jgi:putative flippase GtrA
MLSHFSRYVMIGLVNTGIHWLVFLLLHLKCQLAQASSNLLAFGAAASFSFFVNAHFNFRVRPSHYRYAMFMVFMGLISLSTGFVADLLVLPPLLTLLVFSAISLVAGFWYSKFVVFRSA